MLAMILFFPQLHLQKAALEETALRKRAVQAVGVGIIYQTEAELQTKATLVEQVIQQTLAVEVVAQGLLVAIFLVQE
jgi:hypothetical protein